MKSLLSCGWAAVLGLGLFLAAGPVARADISVNVSESFDDVTITPSSGLLYYTTPLQTSAYSQAGAEAGFNTQSPSTTTSSDTPVPGGLAVGDGTASLSPLSGSSSAVGYIPLTTAGFDTSAGRASAQGVFEILGPTQPVTVTLSAVIDGDLDLSSDAYGVSGTGETIFTLSLNGTPELFNDTSVTIGPSQDEDIPVGDTLTGMITLMPNTQYSLYIEGDAEAEVINSSALVVPEPGAVGLAAEGLAILALVSWVRQRRGANLANRLFLTLLGGALLGAALPSQAKYLGSDAPDVCKYCGPKCTRLSGGTTRSSLSEGNIREDYPVVRITSDYGDTLPLILTYNSYNSDGSKVQLDTGVGFGWTYTYNTLLFQQRGQMFRLGEDGRVTQYYPSGSPGNYVSDTGYFETLTTQSDGTYYITNKNQSWWHFGSVTNTPFLVEGPVYRLLQLGDRNQNVTTFTYDGGGHMTQAQDTYGRTLQFTYDSSNHMTSVTDPLGRITTFQYDAQDRMITQITDPLGKTIQYTYNAQYQMTRKVDRDGRMYFYTYKNLMPYMVTDGSGQPYFSMTNPSDWAVNSNNLAYSLKRQYVPSTTANTDGRGNTWQYAYDPNGYITQITAPDSTTTQYTYDPSTLMLSTMTDANGHVTSYQYDSEGNRLQTTDAMGNVTTYTYEPVFNMMTSMTDPNGRTTTYQYDGNGNRIKETDPLGYNKSWTYDTHGNILSYTDKDTNTTTFTYDGYGNRASRTDPLGNVTTYQYDAIGNRIQVTDPLGNVTRYQYDANNRLIQITDALSDTTTFTYDGYGRTTSVTDQNGHVTSYAYDVRGRLATTTDAIGGVTTTTYDADDNRLSLTDADGHTTTYQYDTLNRVIQQTDALGGVSSTAYDAVGNAISQTDPDGHTTTYTYDALNRRSTMTDALGGVTSYDYSMTGGPPCCSPTLGSSLITEMQDADGNITYYNYDELNRLVQEVRKNSDTNDVINPTDAVTTYTYDPVGNTIQVTDPVTNATTYTYDKDNRVIMRVDAAGDVSTTVYDGQGNMIQFTPPNGNTSTNYYDPLNRIISSYDEIGLVHSLTYDAVGNVLTITDALGHVTTYTYDALNRRLTRVDPLGQTATTAYDHVNNILSTTDRNGHTVTYTYDALNRRLTATDAASDTTTTAYDAVGNITSVTDANGHPVSYTYDALNRNVTITYPDPPPNTVTFTYDAVGNRLSRTDQNGQVTTYTYNLLYFLINRAYEPSGSYDRFTYDLDGRTLTANRNGWVDTFAYDGASRLINSSENGRPFTYTYNIAGRVQTNAQPSGRIYNYVYDARDSLLILNDTTANPPIASYTYDIASRMIMRSTRNGTTTTYTYNADNWPTSLVHSNSAGLIAGFNYTYDNEFNKLSEAKLHNLPDSEAYAYDNANRITNYDVGTLSGSTVPSPTLAKIYNLDQVGNWLTVISNSMTETRTYDPANELTGINTGVLTYDHNGNLTNDTNYAYFYDEENRLTQVQRLSDSALVGQYIYDALGRRIEQIANPAGTPVTNFYYYDESRRVEDQSGGLTIATYAYGPYIDDILTMTRGSQTYYYHANTEYSVHALTDSSGNVAERYAYDVYGQISVFNASYSPVPPNAWGTPHSALTNTFLFTGREWDEEAGLYYFRARTYHDYEGRFIQRDPMGAVDSQNLYLAAFVPNGTDPSGRAAVVWADVKYDNDCTSGGSTSCGLSLPSCKCNDPAAAKNGWQLLPGSVAPTHFSRLTRTYDVELKDGTKKKARCERLKVWRDRTEAHELKHVENCKKAADYLNAKYDGAKRYDTSAICDTANGRWRAEWQELDRKDGAHEDAKDGDTVVTVAPIPTDCNAEFNEEKAAGKCELLP